MQSDLASALGPEASGSLCKTFQRCCQFAIASGSHGSGPCWFSKPDVLGACLLGTSVKIWGSLCGKQTLCSSGRSSGFARCPCMWVAMLGVGFIARLHLGLPYPINVVHFSFDVKDFSANFQGFFRGSCLSHVQLQIWCVCGRRWVQDLPTLPSWTTPSFIHYFKVSNIEKKALILPQLNSDIGFYNFSYN